MAVAHADRNRARALLGAGITAGPLYVVVGLVQALCGKDLTCAGMRSVS